MVARVAYNGTTVGVTSTASVTINTWAAGETCLAAILWYGTQTISSVTMTGESNLTVLGSPQTGGPDSGRVQWAVLDSTSGTGNKTIEVTMSGTPAALQLHVWRLSGGGSHGTPVGASGSSGTLSVSVTTTADAAALFGCGVTNGGTWSAGTGYTKESVFDGYWYDGAEYDIDVGTAGSKTVNATASSGTWCWSAVEIYSAGGGGGGGLVKRLLIMGVGA